jgi:hypothetical protein
LTAHKLQSKAIVQACFGRRSHYLEDKRKQKIKTIKIGRLTRLTSTFEFGKIAGIILFSGGDTMSAVFWPTRCYLNSATIRELSIAFTVGFVALSPRPLAASTFTPAIEEFQIIRDGASVFFDGFNNGTLPTSESVYAVTGPGGMTNESGGRLTMTPALGVPTTGPGNADTITRAVRLTSIDPNNNTNRLGPENRVQVRGLFNVSLPNTVPTVNGQQFGIRLQDGSNASPSNDIASLDVGRNPGGQLRIRFSNVDLVANTSQTADTFIIPSLAGAVFIELIISKDANSVNPVGSFRILDNAFAVLFSGVLDNINNDTGLPVALYNGETFARGAFYSTNETPLPAALPLFATVLAGSGLIAWRRKRKAKAGTVGA